MHNKNETIACDLCVHECDSKIMMYNFNIRTNIAQQEKKTEGKKRVEYRMCKRERYSDKRKFLFTLMKTHTVISGYIGRF